MKFGFWLCASFLAAAVRSAEPVLTDGDTTWLVRGTAAQRAMLHTCREAKTPLAADMEYQNGCLLLNDDKGGCFAALNTHGVVMTVSNGDPNSDPEPPASAQPPDVSRLPAALLPSCETARQAAEEVQKLFDAGRISGGRIFFFADAGRAFIVECSSRHFAKWELNRAFCVYANSWKLPGMDEASTAPARRAYTLYQKEWAAREVLRRRYEAERGISAAASIAASRLNADDLNGDDYRQARDPADGKSRLEIAQHHAHSAGGFLFEIDAEFPGMLSCVYAAFGAPRSTIHLPVPLGAASALPKGTVTSAGTPEKVDPKLVEFESSLLAEFGRVHEEARKLLRGGRSGEAAQLLRDTLSKQTAAAGDFLRKAR